ncbi:MAG: rhamnulokinase [Staphylococcus sp.]|nr:rhamnulokinase [Staphylococcus sp.]
MKADEKNYYIAVDLGATSGRVILASFDGTKVETEEIHRFKHPMLPISGHIFWNLPGLYHEILTGLKTASVKLGEIGAEARSIGIDTWGCDVAYFHPDGTLAGLPYCYRDPHTNGAVDKYCEEIPREKVYEKTGIQFMDFNTLFQLYTLSKEEGNALKNADKILFMPDALAYMLTGSAVTEYTVASTSQIINPTTGELDAELLEKAGLTPNRFGKLVNPGAVIGTITPGVQQFTGLPAIPVVAVAGHDTASAVIGVPAKDDKFAYLSCGTWSLLGIESKGPIINDKAFAYNFTNEGGIDGSIRFLKNICGLWLLERSRTELKDAPENIADLCALFMDSDIDSTINPDDVAFANPKSMTEAIKEYCRESGQRVPETAADFMRVIFRSLALRYKEVLGWLRELSPNEINTLHVIGGGCQNAYLMQMTADAIGIPVVAGPSESTAMGNILVQLRADGKVKDLKEMREVAVNSTKTKTYLPK